VSFVADAFYASGSTGIFSRGPRVKKCQRFEGILMLGRVRLGGIKYGQGRCKFISAVEKSCPRRFFVT
jgi:hypothetical protein